MTGISLMDERGEFLIPELKFKVVSVAADQTDSVLISGVSGKKLRVVSFFFTVGATGTVILESGTTTALTGTMDFGAKGVASFAGSSDAPAFETIAGENLVMTTVGAGANVEGHLCFLEI